MTRARATTARITPQRQLRLPALEIQQGPNRRIYTFAIDGKHVGDVAAVARVRRDDQTRLLGYQRPESLAHVGAIRRYLDTDPSPLLPNAIVIAFDERVRFDADEVSGERPSFVRSGTLTIPMVAGDDPDKPGFIVDGQQRAAAIRDAKIEEFPICVTAFIADTHADQRSQFILVNSTKALPKGLIHELLPEASGSLPVPLMVRQLPATLVERLNFSKTSPLRQMIQTPTNPQGIIKDNSMLRMLENSLSDGALYAYRGGDATGPNFGYMITVLDNFWGAVAEVFPDAWKKPPRRSRLMHGAGIIAMGYLMDAISHTSATAGEIVSASEFAAHLKSIADDCHWTDGVWPFDDGDRAWNDIQNTPRDIHRLSEYLQTRYRLAQTAPAARRSRRGRS